MYALACMHLTSTRLTSNTVATGLSAQLARLISPRQKAWVQAIQKRISYTSKALSSMKDIKVLGLSQPVNSKIQSLREEEMRISKRYRIVQSLDIVLGKYTERECRVGQA